MFTFVGTHLCLRSPGPVSYKVNINKYVQSPAQISLQEYIYIYENINMCVIITSMLEKRGWLSKVFLKPSIKADGLASFLNPMVTMLKQSRPGMLNNRENGLTGTSPAIISFSIAVSSLSFWLFI